MQLTVKEALEQGYTKFGFDGREWQSALDLQTDIDADTFSGQSGKPLLFHKEEYHPGIDAESIKDLLADHIACNHYDETGDDTDNVEDAVRELDFESVAEMINEKLLSTTYYKLTDIELIP
jgi:V8-like Glu-specific endopeptidase